MYIQAIQMDQMLIAGEMLILIHYLFNKHHFYWIVETTNLICGLIGKEKKENKLLINCIELKKNNLN